ncbi:MAG: type II toxin-antitoxin system prevent-host-death family antitoxin [Verrucomicrobiota bacterium]
MTITVTNFKAHCLKILREVEQTNQPVEISKQGKVRFRIIPVLAPNKAPWERLRKSGVLLGAAGASVMQAADFKAAR